MYQENPTEAPAWEHRPVPASVRLAVRVMYAGAAASVLGTAAYIVTWYFDAYVIASSPSFVHGDSGLSITASPVVAWLVGFAGLVVCSLWLCTARLCAQGRNWGRIVATVLLALQAFTLYHGPYVKLGAPRVSWTGLVPVVSFLIGLTAVILLWQRSSAPYFKGERRPGGGPR
jgi:hypothetical protein